MSFVSNLVGFTKKSSLPKLGKSDTYNMYVETKDATEHAFTTVLRPMPGYELLTDIVPGEPQGTFRCSRGYDEDRPAVYGVWGKKLYLLREEDDGVDPYFIADIAGSGKVSFCETSGYGKSAPHLVLCDGVNVYAVTTNMTPIQQKADFKVVTMPLKYPDEQVERITPSWVAYLYGYLVVGAKDTDMFYLSVQFPFETDADPMRLDENEWGKWVFSEWQPDNTITGCSNGSRLFTFGTRSFQVFTFQDSTTNPFASPDTASQNIGIKSGSSLACYGDSVFWLGSSSMGDGSVYMMGADAVPKRISTDEIEEVIAASTQANATAFVMKWKSHPFYVLSFPDNGITLCYDIREGGWTRMGSRAADGSETTFRYSNAIVGRDGAFWLQGNGVLVKATTEKWDEHDSTPILRKRAGGILSSDNKPFKIGAIRLITNNGDYPLMLDRAPMITMRYSRDGATWNRTSTYSLGQAGRYDYDTVFRNLGKVQYLTVEVGTAENIGFALYGMDVSGTTCRK